MEPFDPPEYSPPSYEEANKGFDYSNEHNQSGSPQIQVQTNFTYDNPVSDLHYHQHHHHHRNSSSSYHPRPSSPPPFPSSAPQPENAASRSRNNRESPEFRRAYKGIGLFCLLLGVIAFILVIVITSSS